jgi:hypothetical protein
VEVAPRVDKDEKKTIDELVLILVLVEVAPRVQRLTDLSKFGKSLNPCFSGSCAARAKLVI